MDLNTIVDLQQLKALAYDQIAAKEQAEANLRAINNRIAEVSSLLSRAAPKAPASPTEPAGDEAEKPNEPTGDADDAETTTTTTEAA